MPEGITETRVVCASCGNEYRNHRILHEKVTRWCNGPHEPVRALELHRFVECMGCESLKYVHSWEDFPVNEDYGPREYNVKVYPDAPGTTNRRNAGIDGNEAQIPRNVWKMYAETLQALNANILTLAAGGLRATVEAICLESGLSSGNLQKKIDDLASRNLLTASQAELLHEERYLGNAALHELETPSVHAIEDGLVIVEGLINTIYVLPGKAKRLREARKAKGDTEPRA